MPVERLVFKKSLFSVLAIKLNMQFKDDMVLWSVLYKSYRQISTHTQRETNRQTDRTEVIGYNPTGVRDFFSFSVWAYYLSRANAQKRLFGIFITALQHIAFKTIEKQKDTHRKTNRHTQNCLLLLETDILS